MGKDSLRMMGQRLKNARKNAGLTVDAVAESTGQSVETVRSHEKGARGVRDVVLARYAKLYSVDLGTLRADRLAVERPVSAPAVRGEGMPVIGTVQAGAFREALEAPDGDHERLPIQYDPAYGQAVQFALKVEGRSMDLVYAPGSYVICVSIEDTRPRVGDHVVCRRHRAGLYEFTLKELWLDPKDLKPRLIPRSTDVAYQAPVDLEEGEVDIVAVVIGSYSRRARRGIAAFSED